ncbi:MBL fold metallo-hydrolase [Clostridium cylindrosporum]|uniref:Beta-lactamase domain protein n=1 Tax=Clostridium cylindrosporum DSM 605 TaxID=1121307 RepID=A0A0J8D537_CLOCY|nr:MBL fold metallo-hydrolase [Clostridium cylindrosporum]KMT21275.1 beta-lactamase domain protein [Clostridium cylindrosporum DSM 605]
MILKVFPLGPFEANCYIIGDEETKKGLIIDPSGKPDFILETIKELGLSIDLIILTHGHGDHFTGAYKVKDELGIPLYVHKEDVDLVEWETKELIPILKNMTLVKVDGCIKEGDIINIGNLKLEIIETPGHTMGGVCIKIGNKVFTGDSIFLRSIGRTDLGRASAELLISSLKEKILTLSEDTILYPGHGPSTTVKDEKELNPFLK